MVVVREVYASYYGDMGGLGAAPELKSPRPSVDNTVCVLEDGVSLRLARQAADASTGQPSENPCRPC